MSSEEDARVFGGERLALWKGPEKHGSGQRLKGAKVAERWAECMRCEGDTEVGGWRGSPP